MILLDRYLLKNFLTPLLLCFFGFLSIWLVFDLQSNTSDFLEAGVKLSFVVKYYLTQVPQFMMICIPVGLLLALLFCLSRMSRSNEIIAMLTAGQSLPRVLAPLIIAGLVLTGICAALNYSLAPHADSIRKEMKNGLNRSKRNKPNTLNSQLFPNRADRRVWFVTSMPAKAKADPVLHGVYIIEQNDSRNIGLKWYAATAHYKPASKVWQLINGKEVQLLTDGTIREKPFQTLEISNWSETPWRIISTNIDPAGLSVPELRDYLKFNADFPAPMLAPYRTHLQYRWALPFQCLVVILFTGPLSIVFSRRGVLSGIAGAIFLFAGMTFFSYLMLAFGKGSRLPEAVAAWSPIVLFGAIGVYLIYLKGTNREFPKLSDLFAKPRL